MELPVRYLDRQADFDAVMEQLASHTWIGFDTEFVGERTFVPILCLLQIVSEEGIYLIDTLKIKHLEPFLGLVVNPDILKITHAGDNDYRLLYTLFGTVPANTFDTQIAAGFVGYNYPAGFGRIVEKELRVSISKSHTVADWEARPLDAKALNYAVEDVKFLPQLHAKLSHKLNKGQRTAWAKEENLKWEVESFYSVDPYKEALSSDFIHQLDRREQVFLMRIYAWRRSRAAQLNVPKEQVVQSRHISTILRAIKDGQGAVRANRTLPEGPWKRYQNDWRQLWETTPSRDELDLLKNMPKPPIENPEAEWNYELLYHLVKRQCLECEISSALLLPRGDFNKLKNNDPDFDQSLLSGWRSTLLGPQLTYWLKHGPDLHLSWNDSALMISSTD
jgi:ribonuclease D